jgi:Icc-related predicted phosphoesterase
MIRLAAVGDIHFAADTLGKFAPHWRTLADHADVFLLLGDLTNVGSREQAQALARELEAVPIPTVAVLGNHDYHAGNPEFVRASLERVGVHVLEGEHITLQLRGHRVGFAGIKGFGGGFPGACGHAFGEPEMKAFMQLTEQCAARLEQALNALDADHRIALTHYAPVKDTLQGERLEIFPFLGAFQLGAAIDRGQAQLALHGHAHHGAERGMTAGGVPVRNVALPLLRRPFALYCLDRAGLQGSRDSASLANNAADNAAEIAAE